MPQCSGVSAQVRSLWNRVVDRLLNRERRAQSLVPEGTAMGREREIMPQHRGKWGASRIAERKSRTVTAAGISELLRRQFHRAGRPGLDARELRLGLRQHPLHEEASGDEL